MICLLAQSGQLSSGKKKNSRPVAKQAAAAAKENSAYL